MDLLYSRYASPDQFMNIYINQGRFGEFVSFILEADMKRRKEALQKEDDDKLWLAYVHSMTEQSFHDWKGEMIQEKAPVAYAMTNRQVDAVKQHAKEILNKISPA